MKWKLALILLLIVIKTIVLKAQSENALFLHFSPVFGSSALVADQTYLSKGDSLQISVLRFYISKVELLLNEKSVWNEPESFHLVDASVINSLRIKLNTPSKIVFDKLKFTIGIDSTTNVSGAMGGDLDPTKGMYWTWQNGYINFKLEGKSKACNTRNNEFTFHLGGYQYPYNTLQTVFLDAEIADKLIIVINADELISKIDLSKENHIMSPGKEAVLLSNELTKVFSIQKK